MAKLDLSIFKANDIRGRYPKDINEDVVFEIADKLKRFFKKTIVVGHDARLSSVFLYNSVLKALKTNQNLEIFEAGLITTPQIYFLVNKLKAGGGIVITASHNPREYNGLKVVDNSGAAISGQDLLKIMKK
jgi:phosphomannomutase